MGVSVESLEEEVLGEGIGKIGLKSLGEGVFWVRPQGGPKRPLPYTTVWLPEGEMVISFFSIRVRSLRPKLDLEVSISN